MDLILIPGLLCDPDLWSHQTSHLADIATVHVADVTQEETMVNLAQKVLATAPSRFALAGLSMGGYVAQEIMRQAELRKYFEARHVVETPLDCDYCIN